MRKLFTGICLMLTLIVAATPISTSLSAAFKTGNSEEIASHFGSSVDLSTPTNDGVYSKVQAQLILKKFFLKNKPSDFSVLHNGNSKNNSFYSIGNLTTSSGNFRTYILYKEFNKKATILELKIEAE